MYLTREDVYKLVKLILFQYFCLQYIRIFRFTQSYNLYNIVKSFYLYYKLIALEGIICFI